MFSSPCSLRSTQCATLIALATAAGISRTEQPSATNSAAPVTLQFAHPDIFFATRTRDYHLAATALAPWLPLASVVAIQTPPTSAQVAPAADPARVTQPPPCAPAPSATLASFPPVPAAAFGYFTRRAPTLSIPEHSLPFAVGPPWREIHSRLRAAGTEVPGDSSARRSQVSRIATASLLILRAHAMRATDHGPKSAESFFSPSSALRGEPEFVSSPARHPVRSRLPAWPDSVVFSS